MDQARLDEAVAQHGGLILALDGLQPQGGEEQLWFVRQLFTGLTLHAAWLPVVDEATLKRFLAPVAALGYPLLAVVSDKEQGLPEAVRVTLAWSAAPVLSSSLSEERGPSAVYSKPSSEDANS